MSELQPTTDGIVVIRSPVPGDSEKLIAGRDEASRRWLGPGAAEPIPTGCILVDDEIVGWVDYDVDRSWLLPGEVNIGYNVFAAQRGNGYASRSVQLLMHHLALRGAQHTATLLIRRDNERSLELAARTRFVLHGDLDSNAYYKRPIPALTYTDGVVTLRRQRVDDIDADLEAKDEEQINWLWLPGHRQAWEAMTRQEQRGHARRNLATNSAAFGAGPKWTFCVDAPGASYVAYVDCDLANEHVPAGDANISYASHPAHRGKGYVSRAVSLLTRFLVDHTGARCAQIIVDTANVASIRVAHAVGAQEVGRWIDDRGREMIRHQLRL